MAGYDRERCGPREGPGRWQGRDRGPGPDLLVRREALAALDGLDLALPRGRVTAVVGPSGAGKSTLLRAIAGLTRPDAGDVLFAGESVLRVAPEAMPDPRKRHPLGKHTPSR